MDDDEDRDDWDDDPVEAAELAFACRRRGLRASRDLWRRGERDVAVGMRRAINADLDGYLTAEVTQRFVLELEMRL